MLQVKHLKFCKDCQWIEQVNLFSTIYTNACITELEQEKIVIKLVCEQLRPRSACVNEPWILCHLFSLRYSAVSNDPANYYVNTSK